MNNIIRQTTARLLVVVALLGTSVTLGTLHSPVAQARGTADYAKVDSEAQSTLDDFKSKYGGANHVLNAAKGVLIFPHIYQGGFVVGAEYGKGVLMVGGAPVAHYNIAQGSFGFQIGGQRKGLIMAFMTDEALNKFEASDGFQVGADADVTVVAAGKEGDIDSTTLQKPILAFILDQKGLMGGLSLQGTKITKLK